MKNRIKGGDLLKKKMKSKTKGRGLEEKRKIEKSA